MATWIILLRGVMPTGKNKVPMAPLRAALESAGFGRVRTYIQSGNVIAESRLGRARVESRVHDVIASEFGGDVAALARTPAQLATALALNPFRNADPSKLFLTFLARTPAPELVRDFLSADYSPDRVALIGDTVYGLVADRFATFRANNNYTERRLRVTATTRVSNTAVKLLELSTTE